MPAIPIKVLLKSPWLYCALLSVALALAIAWGRAGWDAADGWKSAARSQERATVATQAAAKAKALAARVATENTFYRLAKRTEEANDTIETLQRDADAFAARRTGRLCAPIAGLAAGGTGTPSQGHPAPLDNGPGQLEVVVLLRPEFDELIAYAKRAEQNRQWGESLILAGLAVPEVEYAKQVDTGGEPSN